MSALVVAGALAVSFFTQTPTWCDTFRITGYVRSDFGPNGRTADGTSIMTGEAIVAASSDIPMGSMIVIRDLGVFRVADRGRLGSSRWIDVAVETRSEAYEITGEQPACVFPPGF